MTTASAKAYETKKSGHRKSKSKALKLGETTPWHEEHVQELQKYIKRFEDYARKQLVVRPFDLMCWGICCGAIEFVKFMWKRTSSPLRSALLGKSMCDKISADTNDTNNELPGLAEFFEIAARDVLEQMPDQESARKLLLTGQTDGFDLGTTCKRSNLLEVAVELDNKMFIAHRYCQGVVKEMWMGRSPFCGRVRLKKD